MLRPYIETLNAQENLAFEMALCAWPDINSFFSGFVHHESIASKAFMNNVISLQCAQGAHHAEMVFEEMTMPQESQ